MPVIITEKKIKSKIKKGDRVAVIENIKYPHFECDEKKNRKLCGRMNAFYSSVAEKYSFHARNKLPKRIKLNRLTYRLPMAVSMNYTIGLFDERIISVVIDMIFSEGKNIKTRRFSQMWSLENGNILPLDSFIQTDRKSKKKIFSLVLAIAKENGENPAFGYYADYLARLSKGFDIKNCFAVPNGICFFIDAGCLSPVKYGVNGFVLTFDKLKDIIKDDFLPKDAENEPQNTDIVNNI